MRLHAHEPQPAGDPEPQEWATQIRRFKLTISKYTYCASQLCP